MHKQRPIKYQSLFDLAADVGLDQIDAEVEVWIEVGEFDVQVAKRAEKLGWLRPGTKWGEISDEDRKLF